MFRRTMSNSLVKSLRCRRLAILLACAALLQPGNLSGEQIAVRQSEGLVHGFLLLHTLDGDHLADGDLTQVARGNRVTTQLVYHFKDGSLHDETAIYSQSGSFRLLSYHLVQKGPTFKTQMDFSIDASSGQVTVRHSGDDGKEEVIKERLKLPPDIANGIVLTLLKNIRPATPRTVSFVAATPKPRLVKLQIAPQGEESFSTGGAKRKATHYVVKVEIGGLSGLVAPLLGKQPSDTHVWILQGVAPAFVKSEGPLYLGGPSWRIELTSPVWQKTPAEEKKE
jgi:hypothetical protein